MSKMRTSYFCIIYNLFSIYFHNISSKNVHIPYTYCLLLFIMIFSIFFFPCFALVQPLNVRLLGAHQPLSAGRRYDLLCQSAGSRPPAVITWWRDGQRLEKTTETVRVIFSLHKFIYI